MPSERLQTAGPPTSPLHFHIGEVRVGLQTEMHDLREEFAALYRRCLHPDAAEGEIAIQVAESRRGLRGRRWSIHGDGEEIGGVHRREEVFPYVEWGINFRVIARLNRFLQLHAATLVRDGQGVIFAAASGFGKSTLTAGLLSRGWKYLSDEFALIDPRTLRLHPFPKALCIKAGAFEVVERLALPLWRRRFYVKAFKGRVGYICPHEIASDVLGGPSPVRFVVFPKYVAGAKPRLTAISRCQAAFALASFILNRSTFGSEAVPVLAEVVRGAECFRLESGQIDETCRLVESLFANAPRMEEGHRQMAS